MLYLFGLIMATGFAVALTAVVGALSQAKAIVAALEGTARQPESSGDIRTMLIIGLAFIESLTIYVLVIAFMLLPRLPDTPKILELLK